MMRGEKIHRALYAQSSPSVTIGQAHEAIAAWFDEYATRPKTSGRLKGVAPMDLFLDGKGPGVDAAELRVLMMAQEVRTIRRNGIFFLGRNYYAPELYARRDPVKILYDFHNLSSVVVCEPDGSLVCEAYPVEAQHPAATVLGNEEDKERLSAAIEAKRHYEKEASSYARSFLRDEVMPEHQRRMAEIGFTEDGKPSVPVIAAPEMTDEQYAAIEAAAKKVEVIDLAQELEIRASEVIHDDEFAAFERLSEMDRYEKLVELSARGEIPAQQAAWMNYYELTAEYASQRDYWEEYRVKMSLMYQRR
jgi:putative transposase